MALISTEIPVQGFEVARDAIGAILKTELENQKALKNFSEPLNVYVGRSTPFQQAEILMINVLLDSGSFSQIHERGNHGGINYFIDIYSSAKESQEKIGGFNSSIRRDTFLGMCRFILQDHHYKTLGLPVGSIMGTYVESFENFEPVNAQDSAFVKMSRLAFNVRINEAQTVWSGIDLTSSFTDVKLEETEKGYKYEIKKTI